MIDPACYLVLKTSHQNRTLIASMRIDSYHATHHSRIPRAESLMMKESTPEQHKDWLSQVAQHKNKAAFAHLFRTFSPKIRQFGLKKLRQEAQALELVQETMLLVWRKAALYHPEKGSVSTWIYTIMRNCCFDMLRKQQSNREDNYSDELWPIFEQKMTVQNEQLNAQLYKELRQYLITLPKHQRTVVEEIYFNQRSHQEIADQMDIPVGTIKSRLRLGLEKLRHHLEKAND